MTDKRKIKSNTNRTQGNSRDDPRSNNHPLFKQKLTFGQKAADQLTKYAGSWSFIIGFLIFLCIWMSVNAYAWIKSWDPYPFILLNLVLSCIAALQAPIILMSQNRQTERDRIDAKYDHAVNRRAEREIRVVQKDLDELKTMIGKLSR